MSVKTSITTSSIGMGNALAIVISYGLNHSIGWAIWHGFLGWFYVLYRWLIVGVY